MKMSEWVKVGAKPRPNERIRVKEIREHYNGSNPDVEFLLEQLDKRETALWLIRGYGRFDRDTLLEEVDYVRRIAREALGDE